MKGELLPCPFCGSTNVAMTLSAAYWVRCLECEAEGPPHEDAEAEAAAAWNLRSDRAGLIAGLREIEPEIRKRERAAPVMIAEILDAIRARIAALETEEKK